MLFFSEKRHHFSNGKHQNLRAVLPRDHFTAGSLPRLVWPCLFMAGGIFLSHVVGITEHTGLLWIQGAQGLVFFCSQKTPMVCGRCISPRSDARPDSRYLTLRPFPWLGTLQHLWVCQQPAVPQEISIFSLNAPSLAVTATLLDFVLIQLNVRVTLCANSYSLGTIRSVTTGLQEAMCWKGLSDSSQFSFPFGRIGKWWVEETPAVPLWGFC